MSDPQKSIEPRLQLRSPPDCLPGSIGTRVFVGGNYELSPVLRVIKEFVIGEKLVPIFVGDYGIPKERTNEYSMRMLYQCSRAIFEITVDSGHTMEVQKVASEPYIKTLLVYMAYDDSKSLPKTITSMIASIPLVSVGYDARQGYRSFDELRFIIKDFFIKTSR